MHVRAVAQGTIIAGGSTTVISGGPGGGGSQSFTSGSGGGTFSSQTSATGARFCTAFPAAGMRMHVCMLFQSTLAAGKFSCAPPCLQRQASACHACPLSASCA
jgi:hypothetical protein